MLIPIPFSHGNSTKSNSSQSGFDMGQWVYVKRLLISMTLHPSFVSLHVFVCHQLMQECGDILDEENDDKQPSVAIPPSINEEVDAPPVPCRTEDSLKLVTESSYDVPGLTYEIPKSPTEAAHPPLQLPSSSQLPPVGEAPPPIPTTKPPQRSSSPQPGHVTPSGSSGFAIGSGGGSAKVKGLKNLFTPKKVCDLLTDTRYTQERHTFSSGSTCRD